MSEKLHPVEPNSGYQELEQIVLAALENKKNESAEGILEQLVTESPNGMWDYKVLGQTLFRLGKMEQAKQALEKAITLDEKNLEAYICLSQIYHDEGNQDLAEACLSSALAFDQNNENILYRLGIVYCNQGANEKSIKQFEKLLCINRKHKLGQYYYAWALYRTKRYQETVLVLEKLILSPLKEYGVRTLNLLAHTYVKLQDAELNGRIIFLFEKVIFLNETSAELSKAELAISHYELAEQYYKKQNYHNALKHFNLCFDDYPMEYIQNVYFGVAISNYKLRNYTEGEFYFKKIFRPGVPVTSVSEWKHMYTFSACLYYQSKYQEILEWLEPQYKLIPLSELSNFVYVMAEAYRYTEQEEKSIEFYKEFIRLEPEKAEGYRILGEIYVYLNRWEDAIELVIPCLDKINLNKKICNLACRLFDYLNQNEQAEEFRIKALGYEEGH